MPDGRATRRASLTAAATALLGAVAATPAVAAETGITADYQFLRAPQWERAIQTWNTSRPFLDDPQPHLHHSGRLGWYLLHKARGRWSWGPAAAFGATRSAADNPDFAITIDALMLEGGALFRWRPARDRPLHVNLVPKLMLVSIGRYEDGEPTGPVTWAGWQATRTLGGGLGLGARVGWDLQPSASVRLSPYLGLGIDPFVWTYRGAVFLNETATGGLRDHTAVFRAQAGLRVAFGAPPDSSTASP